MQPRFFLFVLLICCNTGIKAQSFDWARSFGGTSFFDRGNDIKADAQGNVYTIGSFFGQATIDPSLGATISNGSTDLFILKTNPEGQLLWAKTIGGDKQDDALGLVLDAEGNLYITGFFSDTVDFDPGPNLFTLTASNNTAFILKLSSAGEFIWVKQIEIQGTATNNLARAIKISPSGHLLIGGAFEGTADLDPGPGVYSLTSQGLADMFILKLDLDGQFIWVKTIGTNGLDGSPGIAVDKLNNIYFGYGVSSTIDVDPGPGVFNMSGVSSSIDAIVVKLNADGNFIWATQYGLSRTDGFRAIDIDPLGNLIAVGFSEQTTQPFQAELLMIKISPQGAILWTKRFGSTNDDEANTIRISPEGDLYVTGTFEGKLDFDTGPGVTELTPNGTDFFVLRLNNAGDFIQVAQITGAGTQFPRAIDTDKNGNVYVTGYHAGGDFDPGPGGYSLPFNGGEDVFILKLGARLGAFWHFEGRIFLDVNNNMIEDSTEISLPNMLFKIPDFFQIWSSDQAGNIQVNSNLIGDSLSLISTKPYWVVTPAFYSLDTNNTNFSFAVSSPSGLYRDVRISVVNITPFRPGFDTEIWVEVSNLAGSPAIDTVPVEMILQPFQGGLRPEYMSASINPAFISDSLLRWQIGPLGYLETKTIQLKLRIPATIPIGTPVVLSSITPVTDDADDSNNAVRTVTPLVGSFDPNDKQVMPDLIQPDQVDTTDLQYVIRFQNTGNYPASFVVIRDTLPESLDLSHFEMMGASHPFTWRIFGNQILEVSFDPIFLPDSISDEPGSHGFVAFKVASKKGLLPGNKILNRAGIYFDYNEPVITNYAQMTVAQLSHIRPLTPSSELLFNISPNPATSRSMFTIQAPWLPENSALEVAIYDLQGKVIRQMRLPDHENQVVMGDLKAGTYLVRVRAGNAWGERILIVL